MGLYRIEGIVLRRRNLGEADRLVTVLSRDRGKMGVAARGARRPRSRLGGRLEPPTRFRALVAEGRTLDVISQVEVLEAYTALRTDLEKVAAVAVMLELTDRALADRQPHSDVYRLLASALEFAQRGRPDLVQTWFAARLLALTGHRPAVTRCAACGRRLRGPALWSPALGGCLHAACGARDPGAAAVPQAAAALLAFLLDAGPAAVQRVKPPAGAVTAVGDLLRWYAETRLEVALRAPRVASRIRAGEPRPSLGPAPGATTTGATATGATAAES